MNDETPRPKRRRRRWIVVGVLLFVVGVTGWWYWPRGDAKFVGEWTNITENPQSTLSLRGNGMGRIQGSGFTFAFRWQINDDVLTLGKSFSGGISGVLSSVFDYAFSLLSARWVDDDVTFHVLSVTEQEFAVRRDIDQKVLVFRRLPE